MLPEIWAPGMKVVFVGTAVTQLPDTLGFYHADPKDRFWELLALSSLTPQRVLTVKEAQALAQGHRDGSVSEPVRLMFIEKKTSQLMRLGIGLTDLNRRVTVPNEKDKSARPTDSDISGFITRAGELKPGFLAFVMPPELFVDSFGSRFASATETLGRQPFAIGSSEAWLLGSTMARLRGEALSSQEDAFIALGDRIGSLS